MQGVGIRANRGRLVPRVTRMQGTVIEMNDATWREHEK